MLTFDNVSIIVYLRTRLLTFILGSHEVVFYADSTEIFSKFASETCKVMSHPNLKATQMH
jgi:hypothetical protein